MTELLRSTIQGFARSLRPCLFDLQTFGRIHLFIETPESGQANLGEANLGRNGSIAASTLELSNVDLTRQFIGMITTQRSFQANTKIISTGDEMLETVINMKR